MLNKLVRDKVFANMQEMGQKITHRQLDDQEFIQALKRKLLEEAKEFDVAKEAAHEELADLLEVIETINKELGKDFDELRKIQFARRQKRGGFDQKVYVERLDLDGNDKWVEYYAAEPDRFPEVK